MKLLPKVFLFSCIALAIFVRLRMLNFPLERDEGEYGYAGQLLQHGILPYQGIYNMKFPGTYFMYYFIEILFGQTIQAIRLSLLFMNVLCVYIFFFIAKKWLYSAEAAFIAAGCYCLLSLSDSVQGIVANAEQFVILFALAGIFLLQQSLKKNTLWYIFLSALCFSFCILMKQQGVVFTAFAFGWLFLEKIGKRFFSSLFIKMVGCFLLGLLLPFIVLILWFYAEGILGKFYQLTFLYAHDYISQIPLNSHWWCFNFIDIFYSNPVIWIVCLGGMIATWFIPRNKKISILLWLFLLCSFLGVVPGLYFRPHYYNLILPAASLFTAISFVFMIEVFKAGNYIITALFFVLIIGSSIYYNEDYYFRLSVNEESQKIYPNEPFSIMQDVGNYLKQHSSPSDRIGIIGPEPEIYFYAQRRSATSLIYTYPLMESQRFKTQMRNQFFEQIDSIRPLFLLFSDYASAWNGQKPDTNLIHFYLQQAATHYDLIAIADTKHNTLLPADSNDSFHPNNDYRLLILKRRGGS